VHSTVRLGALKYSSGRLHGAGHAMGIARAAAFAVQQLARRGSRERPMAVRARGNASGVSDESLINR